MKISLRAFPVLATGLLLAVTLSGCRVCSDCNRFHVRDSIRRGMDRMHLPRLGMPRFLSRGESTSSHSGDFHPIEPMAVPYEPVPNDAIVLPAPAPTTLNPPAHLPRNSVPAVPSFEEDAVPLPSANAPRRLDTLRPISHEVEVIGTETTSESDVIQPVCNEVFGSSCSTCYTSCGKVSLLDRLRSAMERNMAKWTKGKCKSCDPCSICPSPCDPCFTRNEVIMEGVVISESPCCPMPCDPCFGAVSTWAPPVYYPPAPVYSYPPQTGYPAPQPPCSQCQRQQAWRANPWPQQQQWQPTPPPQHPVPHQHPAPQQQAWSAYPQPQQGYQQGFAQPQPAPTYPTPAYGPTPAPAAGPTPVQPQPQPTPVTHVPGYSPVQPTYTR